MSNYTSTADISGGGYHGGSMGGMGGGWLIGALIIFFLLFRDGFGHKGGHGEGHKGIHTDECNREQDYKWLKEQGEHDRRVVGEIVKSREIADARYIEGLRDKILERDGIILEQKNQMFVGGLFGQLNRRLDMLECGLPKARPQYASTVTPCLGELPRCGEPVRGGCPTFID